MKKFLFINALTMCVGVHLLAGNPAVAQQARPALKGNNAKQNFANKPAANKPIANKNFKKHCSCSSSSSWSRGPKVICCDQEKRFPIFVSAVADGTANEQFVAPGDPIVFNTVLNISASVFYNSSTGVFTVTEPGTYEIIYGARFTGHVCLSTVGNTMCTCCTDPETCTPLDTLIYDPCASIAVQINGTEVAGSQVNNGDFFDNEEFDSADWVSVAVIQTVNAGATIAVCAAVADVNGIQLVNLNECDPECTNGDSTAFVTIKKL